MSHGQELVSQVVAIKNELTAEGVEGSTVDPNADPRLHELGNLLMLLESFYWEDYKGMLIEHFEYSPDYFKS